MLTYTHPFTFCWVVCQEIAERGWKIRTFPASGKLVLPNGLAGAGLTRYAALVALCRAYATRYRLPIALEIDEKYHQPVEGKEPRYTPRDTDDLFRQMEQDGAFFSIFDEIYKADREETFRAFARKTTP